MMILRLPLYFLLFCFSIQLSAQDLQQRLDSLVLEKNLDTFYGALAVSKKGIPIYERYFGYQDSATQKLNDSTSVFRIGRLSELYTSALIFQQIEKKKLKLDTPLSKFYPNITDADSISISRLLIHKSGLENTLERRAYNDWLKEPHSSNILQDSLSSIKTITAPGYKTDASTTNYILLSLILEQLTDMPYRTLLEKNIEKPLLFVQTTFADTIPFNSKIAVPYTLSSDSLKAVEQIHPSNVLGASGLLSNPIEMNMFLFNLFDNNIISKKSVGYMVGYHGFVPENIKGRIVYGLQSDKDGYTIASYYFPEEELALSYAFNYAANDLDFKDFWKTILNIPVRKEITLASDDLEQFTGVYALQGGIELTVEMADEKLYMSTNTGMPQLALLPMNSNSFFNKSFNIELTFTEDASGQMNVVADIIGSPQMQGVKK